MKTFTRPARTCARTEHTPRALVCACKRARVCVLRGGRGDAGVPHPVRGVGARRRGSDLTEKVKVGLDKNNKKKKKQRTRTIIRRRRRRRRRAVASYRIGIARTITCGLRRCQTARRKRQQQQ